MKSWKTTLGGILLGISPILVSLEDDKLKLLGTVLAAIGGFLMTQARDNDVTSEDAGATPKE